MLEARITVSDPAVPPPNETDGPDDRLSSTQMSAEGSVRSKAIWQFADSKRARNPGASASSARNSPIARYTSSLVSNARPSVFVRVAT